VFVSIKPLHVSVFFHDHLQGVLRCALCRYYSSCCFAFVEFVLLGSMWPHVYVICVCLVFLSVGNLLVHKQIINRQDKLKTTVSERVPHLIKISNSKCHHCVHWHPLWFVFSVKNINSMTWSIFQYIPMWFLYTNKSFWKTRIQRKVLVWREESKKHWACIHQFPTLFTPHLSNQLLRNILIGTALQGVPWNILLMFHFQNNYYSGVWKVTWIFESNGNIWHASCTLSVGYSGNN